MFKRFTFFVLCMMLSLGITHLAFAEEGYIIYSARPDLINAQTGGIADQEVIDHLIDLGYEVEVGFYDNLGGASEDVIDALNAADLVILGRSMPSTTAQSPHKEVWNSLTVPLMQLSVWSCRNTRMNWINSGTCSNLNENEVLYATIEKPEDPVFAGIDLNPEECPWAEGPVSVMVGNDPGNGEVLARNYDDESILFIRWEPDIEFYPGSGDSPSGPRTMIGNGNDEVTDDEGNQIINYMNWSDVSLTVFEREVARMVALSTGVSSSHSVPDEFSLLQNYPNPFNPVTNIRYVLPKSEFVTLTIFNLMGQEVAGLVNSVQAAGVHRASWNASNLPGGLYLYKLQAGSFSATRKLLLQK